MNYIKSIISRKERGSSLIEVIIALVICMIIFILSTNILLKNEQTNNVRLKQKALLVLSPQLFNEGSSEVDNYLGLKIHIETDTNDSIPNLKNLHMIAKDNNGKILAKRFAIIEQETAREKE